MSDTTSAVPNPGSDEALMRGCTCPVIDNGHGRGYRGLTGAFVYVAGCPVHWPVGATLGPCIAVQQPAEKG